ncbi:acyl-CoA N-acyltransferase [Crepidotus variabilis]|uniref:Acyl-CoA N-acyltransferase n=1 Tax=Crepidotus variabilis TaxID=179855 RepID=A0A9P6JSL4_9AGAR|nr:acyl-CoA N-acyltransferase [Crepidotus variabilis]
MNLKPPQPLQFHPNTNEPFLRLRNHKNVILTPYRLDDTTGLVRILNDPLVYKWLYSTKFPFTLEDAKTWLDQTLSKSDAMLAELADGPDYISGTPLTAIREIQEDGTDILIGNITLARFTHGEIFNTETVDWENADENIAENLKLETGNPNIIWTIGDYLASTHHGRGIMSDAIQTIVYDWGVPKMNVRRMMIGAMVDNPASIKVFAKNDFKFWRRITDFDYSPYWGRMRDVEFHEWTL